MKETDPRFISLRKKVGLFFAITVILILTTIIFIGVERDLFTPKYSLYFTVDKGTGFFAGMPVKLSGFKIGKIDTISLDENARVKVSLLINKKYQKWIREDSRAALTKEGLIGESIIDITVGALSKSVLRDNATINYERTKGLDEIIEDIRPVLSEIKNIINYMNDPKGDIKQTIGNLKTLSSELHKTRENIDVLLKNTDVNISNVASNVTNTVKNVDSLVDNVDKTVAGIDGKIAPVIDKLNNAMDNAEKATSSLKDAMEKVSPKVPSLLSKGEDALNDTKDIVKSLRQMWPIRLFVEEPKDVILYGDSYE